MLRIYGSAADKFLWFIVVPMLAYLMPNLLLSGHAPAAVRIAVSAVGGLGALAWMIARHIVVSTIIQIQGSQPAGETASDGRLSEDALIRAGEFLLRGGSWADIYAQCIPKYDLLDAETRHARQRQLRDRLRRRFLHALKQ